MPSPKSSRLNLTRWRERAGLRSAQESLAIKRCIWQWGLLSAEHRKPATQGELARALGVRRQYVTRILKSLVFDAPLELLAASPVTPAHVITMRQQYEQFRRQQETQAQREVEDWNTAWHDEEARAQNSTCRQDSRDAYSLNASGKSDEEELRRTVLESDNPDTRELCQRMFPWLKL